MAPHSSPPTAKTPSRRRLAAIAAGALALAIGVALAVSQARDTPKTPVDYGYTVVNVYPHDRNAFTQGLLFRDGFLFESTGLNGQSSLRKVVLETGAVIQQQRLSPEHFAEGLADWNDSLIQLTWQSQLGIVYGLLDFQRRRTFEYPGEGWGLARDDERLIMSDGTSMLRYIDPETLKETGRVQVTDDGRPLKGLNELEMVKGELYANVWPTPRIVIIDPDSGRVTGRLDLPELLPSADRGRTDVLNGIAYDAERDRLFVTGKLWPKLFEIRLEPRK